MQNGISRRRMLSGLGTAGALLAGSRPAIGQSPPAGTVAIGKCPTYDKQRVTETLETAFDQIGGLGRLVKGKTVSIKLNLNGGPNRRLGDLPLYESHFPHPILVGATLHLMGKAGVKRVRLLECAWAPSTAPLEDHLMEAGWDWRMMLGIVPKLEFENTNFLGTGKKYSRFAVPGGGMIFPAYDLNHCYEECDVFMSVTKPKDHSTCGVTLGMKNVFGTTPITLYGNGVRVDPDNEDQELPRNSRIDIMHFGRRQPSDLVLPEIDPASSRDEGHRIPRVIVDLCSARPLHVTIFDAIYSMAGGQGAGPRNVQTKPGLIVVGNNPVSSDAVMTALMNYNPAADRGETPFNNCDSTMALGEKAGLGSRDLNRIEVAGERIEDNICDYLALRKARERNRARSRRSS